MNRTGPEKVSPGITGDTGKNFRTAEQKRIGLINRYTEQTDKRDGDSREEIMQQYIT